VKVNVKNWKGDKKMGKIRKKYDAALKARIALEAVKGEKTMICPHFLEQDKYVYMVF